MCDGRVITRRSHSLVANTYCTCCAGGVLSTLVNAWGALAPSETLTNVSHLLGDTYNCMYANLIEDLNDGTLDHDYDLRSIGDQKSVRYDIAAAADLPATLTISHVETGKGDDKVKNSLLRFDRTVERASDEKQGTVSAYLVIRQPVKVMASGDAQYVVNQLIDFLSTATYADKLIAGEI